MAACKGYHHIAMRVRDFDRSVSFYTDALGFRVGRSWGAENQRAVMIETGGGSYLEIFEGADADREAAGESPLLHFALRVDDCDALLNAVRKAGAEITVEPKDVDIPSDPTYPVRIAFFKGPDGEIVELFQER